MNGITINDIQYILVETEDGSYNCNNCDIRNMCDRSDSLPCITLGNMAGVNNDCVFKRLKVE